MIDRPFKNDMELGYKGKKFNIDLVIVTRERYPQLINCINHILSNSIKPKRIIIVDSSSNYNKKIKDEIVNLGEKAGIILNYLKVPHQGVGCSRNIGLLNVESSYFAFVDDDEYVPKLWLRRVSGIFNSKKDIHVLAGPKIPLDNKNYWHRVMRSLIEKEFNYEGKVDTIPSGNSIYLTSFVKKHRLSFDERFRECSEDQAFSYELRRAGANIYFHRGIWVKHDLRSKIIPFVKQWFYYGKNKFLYQKYYLGSGSVMELPRLDRTLRNFRRTFPYSGSLEDIRIWSGVALLNFVFITGFLYAFVNKRLSNG